jgi:hypothetical protein
MIHDNANQYLLDELLYVCVFFSTSNKGFISELVKYYVPEQLDYNTYITLSIQKITVRYHSSLLVKIVRFWLSKNWNLSVVNRKFVGVIYDLFATVGKYI